MQIRFNTYLSRMKNKFKSNLESVLKQFGLTEPELFRRTKQRLNVDARQVLFLMCRRDGIPICYIQDYLEQMGYNVTHSTIIHGINRAESTISCDRTIRKMIENESGVSAS